MGTRLEFGQASVEITAETRGFEHVAAIVATLHAAGLFTRAPTD